MNTFVFPMTSKKDSYDAQKLVAKVFRIATVIMIPVTIFSAILIYPAIYFLYGAEYLPIVSPFLIILVGVAFSSVTGTLVSYFMGIGRPGLLVQTLFLPVFVQIVLGYWAKSKHGENFGSGCSLTRHDFGWMCSVIFIS